MRKALLITIIVILILILFKGVFFRLLISYNEIGTRDEIEITNPKLIDKINSEASGKNIDLKEIIRIANSITCKELEFTASKTSNNPNVLITTKKANCIGYSAMFNSITCYLIRQNNLEKKIEARHVIGKIDLLGIDLHQFFKSSFFQNHDFSSINNCETGEIISVDPVLNDYLGITKVCVNK